MESAAAIGALAALAHETRLGVFRALVRAGPSGESPGAIATQLDLPASTLSFHLAHLTRAGLLEVERQGRSLRYTVAQDVLRELFWFLGEDCCQGRPELCPDPTSRIESQLRSADAPAVAGGRETVLFLCSRNSARSQMAEASLRRKAGDRFEVLSGGLRPSAIHPLTLRVLEEAGHDTSALRTNDLGDFLGKVPIHHAVVVCEAADAHCPQIAPFARTRLYWPFPDPVAAEGSEAERLDAFRRVRDAIDARVVSWVDEELQAVRAAGGGH